MPRLLSQINGSGQVGIVNKVDDLSGNVTKRFDTVDKRSVR